MLEHLINDNEAKARELFHDIVVAKSREIYENLLADDFEEEETEEGMEMEPEEGMGYEEETMGGDEADDMLGDVESDDMGDEDDMGDMGGDEFGGDDEMGMGGEEELGDRLDDLEAELEALKDEFESLMGGEEGEEGGMGGDDMGGDEFGGEEEEEGEEEGMYFEKRDEEEEEEEDHDEKTDEDFIREYVEKVGGGKDYTSFGKMGDDGVNTKSIVAGKNDMGGTAKNIAQAGTETPTFANQGQLKGTGVFKGSKPQLQDGGNINKPGGNAGKTAFKKKEPGHGAEKKSTGDNGDRSADSPINGAPGRAK